MPPYFYILIALSIVFGLWLLRFLKRQRASWRAGMDALQRSKGWIVKDVQLSGFGKPGTFEVIDPDGQWRVESIIQTQTQGVTGYQIQFTAAHPSASGGTLLLGPPLPDMGGGLIGSMMGGMVIPFLAKASGLPAEDMMGMRQVAVATKPPISLIATPGAENWVDPAGVAAVLEPWKSKYPSEKTCPIVILGGGELRVRVRTRLVEPREVKEFVETALAVRDAVTGTAD